MRSRSQAVYLRGQYASRPLPRGGECYHRGLLPFRKQTPTNPHGLARRAAPPASKQWNARGFLADWSPDPLLALEVDFYRVFAGSKVG